MRMPKANKGFTLLELILVIALIGILISVVAFSFDGDSRDKVIEQQAKRFHAVVNMAAEHAMLNQVELGLIFEDNEYRFVAFDGQRWRPVSGQKYLEPLPFDEFIDMTLELEGLEWAEDNILNTVSFQSDEDEDEDSFSSGGKGDSKGGSRGDDEDDEESAREQDEEESDEDRKKLTPQIFLLSSGDITPFLITLVTELESGQEVYYQIKGEFSAPVSIEGPLDELP